MQFSQFSKSTVFIFNFLSFYPLFGVINSFCA
nr:MAG TPA: hypothetical protein [Caudoviricetes sp.]